MLMWQKSLWGSCRISSEFLIFYRNLLAHRSGCQYSQWKRSGVRGRPWRDGRRSGESVDLRTLVRFAEKVDCIEVAGVRGGWRCVHGWRVVTFGVRAVLVHRETTAKSVGTASTRRGWAGVSCMEVSGGIPALHAVFVSQFIAFFRLFWFLIPLKGVAHERSSCVHAD